MMFPHRSFFLFFLPVLFLLGACSRDDAYSYSNGMVEIRMEVPGNSPSGMDSLTLPILDWAKNQAQIRTTFSYSDWGKAQILLQPEAHHPLPVLVRDLDHYLSSKKTNVQFRIIEHSPAQSLGEFASKVPLKANDAVWMQEYFAAPGLKNLETINLNPAVQSKERNPATGKYPWFFEAGEEMDSVADMRFYYLAKKTADVAAQPSYAALDSSLDEIIKSMNLFPTDWKLEPAASHREWTWICLYGPPSEALLDHFESMESMTYSQNREETIEFPDYHHAFSFLDILATETFFPAGGDDPDEAANLMLNIFSDKPRGLSETNPPILRVNGRTGMILFLRPDAEIKKEKFLEDLKEKTGTFASQNQLKIQISEAHFDPKRFFFYTRQ